VLEGHTSNAEFALAMCSTQPYVLSGGKDKFVVLWSIQDHISTLPGGDSTNRAVSIVKTADSASLSLRGIFQGHMDTVEDVQFHPKSVGDDSCLILWDERGGKVLIPKVEKAHNLDWCPDKSSVFGSSIEDGRVNIYVAVVGRTTEHGPSALAGLFFNHCGHTAQVTDFHWNDHAPWIIVSVSASYNAELNNAESHDAESDYTESDDDDAESGYTESDDDDAEPDDPEFDDDETTSGGGTLLIWQMHDLTYKAVLNNTV
nr:hypothetical protein [Tanacetum cinerariifolium]